MRSSLSDRLPLGEPGVEAGGVAPQPFEVVVRTCGRVEHVDHDIAVVQQHPLGIVFAFAPERLAIDGPEPFLHCVGESLHLSPGATGGDHKDVGDHQQLVDVEEDDVQPLLVVQSDRGSSSQGLCFCSDLDGYLSGGGDVAAHNDTDVNNSRASALHHHFTPADQ